MQSLVAGREVYNMVIKKLVQFAMKVHALLIASDVFYDGTGGGYLPDTTNFKLKTQEKCRCCTLE